MTACCAVFEPGFFASLPVQTALWSAAVVAVVSGIVGTFTVMRGQSFAGHALGGHRHGRRLGRVSARDQPAVGFVGDESLAAAVMEMIGIRRPRGRDLATGIVLGAGARPGRAVPVLGHDGDEHHAARRSRPVRVDLHDRQLVMVPVIVLFSVVAAGHRAVLYRPLMLSSISTDLAAAPGVRVRLVGVGTSPRSRWRCRCRP